MQSFETKHTKVARRANNTCVFFLFGFVHGPEAVIVRENLKDRNSVKKKIKKVDDSVFLLV